MPTVDELVRDGAAGGCRPLLRRAQRRRRTAPSRSCPAQRASDRLPSGRRARCSGRRRTSTRRSSRSSGFPRPHRLRRARAGRRRARSRIGGRRSRTRSRSTGVATREQAVAALAALGHRPGRPRRGARAVGVRRAQRAAPSMSDWQTLDAPAKLNLALVVGPLAAGRHARGRHRAAAPDARATRSRVDAGRTARASTGSHDDTLVRAALDAADRGARADARVRGVRSTSGSPSPRGSGAAARDAAAALRLANDLLDDAAPARRARTARRSLGADVPFFLRDGPQLGTGDGTTLAALDAAAAATPCCSRCPTARRRRRRRTSTRPSTRDGGDGGFDERRAALLAGARTVSTAAPTSPRLPAERPRRARRSRRSCESLGAFRADVSGAGPVVYGLFADRRGCRARAGRARRPVAATWIAAPR